LFIYQHKDSLGAVHFNSNLPAVGHGDECDAVQYPEKIHSNY